MSEYYNTQQRIPRRRSATSDAVAQRQTPTGSALSTHTRHTDEDDDDASSSPPMRPIARRLDYAPLTAASPTRHYVIPMTDGTEIHVTERRLADMPKEYRRAARLVTPAPPKRQMLPTPQPQQLQTDDLPRQPRRRFHWLFWVGIAMVLMVVGWIAFSFVSSWWTNQTNQWAYGYPRTYQVDENVGHGTTTNPNSHFIAMNLQGRIMVIEVPGDDPGHMKVYTITYILAGQDASLVPVTLSFKDVNNDGKLDLIVNVQDSHIVFLNTGTGFKPAPNQ